VVNDLSREVAEVIAEGGLRAQILEFTDTVETVYKASKLVKERPERIVKTILVKTEKGEYVALIIRGDRRIDNYKLKTYLGCDVRLATAGEVLEVLKVPLGAVSPLLRGISTIRKIVDPKILEEEYVICGGGSLNTLVRIVTEDLIKSLNNSEIVDVFK